MRKRVLGPDIFILTVQKWVLHVLFESRRDSKGKGTFNDEHGFLRGEWVRIRGKGF